VTLNAEFWVAISFILFVLVLVYFGTHRMIVQALDQRSARIKAELDEARRLREEAAQLVAHYRQRQQAAEGEAATIIEGARADAERYAAETKARMEDFVARRTRMAETKIAQAEAQALADVRSAAAEAAVAAAEKILSKAATGKVADELLAQGIRDIKAKLN
jgi:F-type H+-transporting ATPase subunit b